MGCAAKAARVGARYLASKSVTGSGGDYVGNAKKLVVYGNIAGTGSPVLPGMTLANVDVQYQGEIAGVPDTVTVTIINYQHDSIINLGALLKSETLSLDVDVKPSVTMRYLLTQPSV